MQKSSESYLYSILMFLKKKKFEIFINIDANFRKYVYYTNCEKFSKYLLDLSKATHSFTISVFERLANQKTLANYGIALLTFYHILPYLFNKF